MRSVYVLLGCHDYAGCEVLAVCTTQTDAARVFAEAIKQQEDGDVSYDDTKVVEIEINKLNPTENVLETTWVP